MRKSPFDLDGIDIAWCPGCGNFNILEALKRALENLGLPPQKVILVSGIGQAAKIPHYIKAHIFNGLHGRALPPATAIKAVNPELTVIAESGDGDMYGEGGNHLLHAFRRNPDITCIVHDNMVYGLTKGQASPTSLLGFRTPVQVKGVFLEPFNPISLAVAMDASFVARCFAGDVEGTAETIETAVRYKGFALVDILQPCVSYNRLNTFQWFKEKTYRLPVSHDPLDRDAAWRVSRETDRLPLGVVFKNPGRKTFEENIGIYKDDPVPLPLRSADRVAALWELIQSKK